VRPNHDVDLAGMVLTMPHAGHLTLLCGDHEDWLPIWACGGMAGARLSEVVAAAVAHMAAHESTDVDVINVGSEGRALIPVVEISEHSEIDSSQSRPDFFPRRGPGTPRPVPHPSPRRHG
jgi:hypothetical protein